MLQRGLRGDPRCWVPLQAACQEVEEVLIVGLDGSGQLLGARPPLTALGVGQVLRVPFGVCIEQHNIDLITQTSSAWPTAGILGGGGGGLNGFGT